MVILEKMSFRLQTGDTVLVLPHSDGRVQLQLLQNISQTCVGLMSGEAVLEVNDNGQVILPHNHNEQASLYTMQTIASQAISKWFNIFYQHEKTHFALLKGSGNTIQICKTQKVKLIAIILGASQNLSSGKAR